MLPEFMLSFFGGIAASGALTSGLRLITKAALDKSHDGLRKGSSVYLSPLKLMLQVLSFAILVLAISIGIEFLCFLLYALYFPKLPIVKYFHAKAALEGLKTVTADLAAAGIHQVDEATKVEDFLTTKELLHRNWYFLDLYLIYVLSLSIFPGFLYENTGKHSLGYWYPLVLIATYNVLNLIGRYTTFVNVIRIQSRKGLSTSIIARFVFVPTFYFTAKYAREGWMIMLVGLLGLTNGHLTVCVMTTAPKGYKGPEQYALGNLLVLFMLAGVFSGVCLDWLWIIGDGAF